MWITELKSGIWNQFRELCQTITIIYKNNANNLMHLDLLKSKWETDLDESLSEDT